jgi:hypothetical protein
VYAVLDRPVNGDADESVSHNVRDEFRGDAFGQVFSAQPPIVQKRESRLTAAFLFSKVAAILVPTDKAS